MKKNRHVLALLGCGAIFFSLILGAESQELKNRMQQRKPALDAMKAKGTIGENNLGYLEFKVSEIPAADDATMVTAENSDRKTIYAEIAARVNTSIEEVGKRRALQIAALAEPGTWLQDTAGNWYRKT